LWLSLLRSLANTLGPHSRHGQHHLWPAILVLAHTAERETCIPSHSGNRSDNSPSRKGRGFYGLPPMRCCPRASQVVAFNTAEVEGAATASRPSTTSTYARAVPRGNDGPRNRQTRVCWQGAYGPQSRAGARLRARRPVIPLPSGRGLLAAERNGRGDSPFQGDDNPDDIVG
jgi:hypothetical protein